MLELLHTSYIYKLLALQLMLGEANFFATNLHLGLPAPIQGTEVKQLYVAPPHLLPQPGLAGNLQTTNYAFGFAEGRLGSLRRLLGDGGFVAQYDHWATLPSRLDAHGAQLLASQWLAGVSVDVAALERRHPASVTQLEVLRSALAPSARARKAKGNKQLLPVFFLKWGDAVEMTILGAGNELLELHIADRSWLRRKPLALDHADEISRLPDRAITNREALKRLSSQELLQFITPDSGHRDSALKLMLDEVNRVCRSVRLDQCEQVKPGEVRDSFVWHPRFGHGGFIQSGSHLFRFGETGHLTELRQLSPRSAIQSEPVRPGFTTNSALALAEQWLEALSVDLAVLHHERLTLYQDSAPNSAPPRLLPRFHVAWGTRMPPVVEVWVSGATATLDSFTVRNPALFQHPGIGGQPPGKEAAH